MPLWDDERDSIWMLPGYLNGIEQAGGIPFIFPLGADEEDAVRLCGLCDGFLFTGGHDVSPALYGEEPVNDTIAPCAARDALEAIVLRQALRQDKPLLGICRGIQFLNAALGGTLYQDLPSQHPSSVNHHMRPPYDRAAHRVRLVGGSPLQKLLGVSDLGVNSYHHQAVRELAPGLRAMAESEDGLVEAVYLPSHTFAWAVQWHPEFSYKTDAASRAIFEAFVRSARI